VKMMKGMLIALAPAVIWAIYSYRFNAVLLIIISIVAAVGSEALYQFLFKKPLKIKDLSAVVTGLLLALTVSPSLPLYVVAIGSAVGIVVGKQLFGGFGKNLFNPALFGRIFIIYAFPGTMTPWLSPVDVVATATPLQLIRSEGTITAINSLFFGTIPGSLGETSALLLLLGAGWLLYNRYANWRIPLSVIATVAVVSLITGQNIAFHLFSGSLVLGAFFMATDPVSSPKTQTGRYLFGFGVGLLIMSMRLWGWLPEGTTFAILIMNLTVPFINSLTKTKPKITNPG
jgi:Na+-translocating ferredoxin:NAD+ oxidoreductase subunit D